MRTSLIGAFCCIGLILTSCNSYNSSDRNDPAARQAGREAYKASQELKKGAKKAAHDLQSAGKEFSQGWSEAKQRDANRHQADRQSTNPSNANRQRAAESPPDSERTQRH